MTPNGQRRDRTSEPFDGMPDPRLVVWLAAVFIVAVSAIGLASLIDTRTDGPAAADVTNDQTTPVQSSIDDVVLLLPASTPIGLLDREQVKIADGFVTTLVTTDGSGKVEYGVVIEGDAASSVQADELSVVTASGNIFTPSEINRDGQRISTTINAEHGQERWVALRWIDGDVMKFLLHNGWTD
jgi:hypothetical protein